MAGIFGETIETKKRLPTADIILDYTRAYHRLLRDYKEEIQLIESMMEKLRKERETFYLEKRHEIEKSMIEDDVSPELRQQWMKELTENMEKSFQISEMIIKQYVTDNLEEFRSKIEEAIDRINDEKL